MVDALELTPQDTVIEIGAGLGAVTQRLVHKLIGLESKIYAVEIDNRLTTKLKMMFAENTNMKVVEANILDWLPTVETEKPFKVLGSLPFYITSPIIHTIIKMKKQPEICVLMTQKEVAHKICAQQDKASYMSTFVQTFFETNYINIVPRNKFNPVPKVDGAIIKLKSEQGLSHLQKPHQQEQIYKYERFLHKGFSNPRKMLNKIFSKEELTKTNTDGNLRAQNITPKKWVEMFELLVEGKPKRVTLP